MILHLPLINDTQKPNHKIYAKPKNTKYKFKTTNSKFQIIYRLILGRRGSSKSISTRQRKTAESSRPISFTEFLTNKNTLEDTTEQATDPKPLDTPQNKNFELYSARDSFCEDENTDFTKDNQILLFQKNTDPQNNLSLNERISIRAKRRDRNMSLNLGVRKGATDPFNIGKAKILQNIDEEGPEWKIPSRRDADTISTKNLMADLKDVDGLVRKSLGEVKKFFLKRSHSVCINNRLGKGFMYQDLDPKIFEGNYYYYYYYQYLMFKLNNM